MTNIRRILFAIRNPEAARQPGMAKAIQVARKFGAKLELFHALTDALFIDLARREDNAVDRLRERVEGEARIPLVRLCEVARKHGVHAESSVEWDCPPHEAIVRRAAQIGADLIIVECHRGARTRPWLIHLTNWELLRTSPVPVLLLKSGKPYRRPLVLAAVDPGHAHAKPHDLDTRIVTAATELAGGLKGAMHLMHASYPSFVGPAIEAARRKAATSWSTFTFDELKEQERQAFETFRDSVGVPRRRTHLADGNPASEIPQLANELHADIVVMGAVSRSGLVRVFIGNTAERILGKLECDVLVVRPGTFTAPIARESRGLRVHTAVTLAQ
jgi:universal stress protein E